MINDIYYKKNKIIDKKKDGRRTWFIFEDGSIISSSEFRIKGNYIEIKCHECGNLIENSFYHGKNGLMNRRYVCQSCNKKGNKNPFFGMKHTESFKEKLSTERKGLHKGDKNPMYGVNVWDSYTEERAKSIKEKISKSTSGNKNPFFGKTHSEEIRRRLSESAAKYMINNPDHLKKMVFSSLKKQSEGFKSKIESSVELELKNRGIKYKYNKILHRKYQYDFIIEENILLEVHGDYWHGNPLYYGDNKKELNNTQKFKKERDVQKKDFAINYGYKIYYIWETDINKKDYSIIDQIEKDILSQKGVRHE